MFSIGEMVYLVDASGLTDRNLYDVGYVIEQLSNNRITIYWPMQNYYEIYNAYRFERFKLYVDYYDIFPQDKKERRKMFLETEPKNNDGLEKCFWCGEPTKKIDTGFSVYDVCTSCGK